MCTVLLPPGVNPTAVNKYIKYHDLVRSFVAVQRSKLDSLTVVPSVHLTPGDGTDQVLETMHGETPEDNVQMNNFGAPTRPRPLNPLNEQRIDAKWDRILEKLKAPRR